MPRFVDVGESDRFPAQLHSKQPPMRRKGRPRNSPSPGIRRVGMLPRRINSKPETTRNGLVKHQMSLNIALPAECI
ncbi:MAG TPA: hypothetical protein V6D12_20875 [Candidatus Obscuribacterales bacterium]